jgi:polar amino acid transport system substrate-binding protein
MKSALPLRVRAALRSRRQRITAALCAVVVIGAATFGAVKATAADNRISTSGIHTITPGTLTVCADFPYAPFDLDAAGVYSGIDVDIVNAVGTDLGYRVVFKPTVFDGIFDAVRGGQCDMVASAVSISEERKKSMLFSNGYFEINQSLMVRPGNNPDQKALSSLQGQKIGVQSGTTGEAYANDHSKGAQVVPFDDVDSMYDALENGAINGVINDFPVNSYRARQDPGFKVIQTFNDVGREEYGFALPFGAERLQAAVNQSLDRIQNDGRYDEILSKYLGSATAL